MDGKTDEKRRAENSESMGRSDFISLYKILTPMITDR
jgi:hypothetical protein